MKRDKHEFSKYTWIFTPAKKSQESEQVFKEQFQKALKMGHVDSITLFAKCHHGWAYFPSEANERHPCLDFDLLGSQIEAAHEIGVKTPVYISAGLDENLQEEDLNGLQGRKTTS